MKKHQLRFFTILGLTVLVLALLGLCLVFTASDGVVGACSGALMLLIPALIDASAVERRRRSPTKVAVVDDVRFPSSDESEDALTQ
jgi:uncharacterized membrane protein